MRPDPVLNDVAYDALVIQLVVQTPSSFIPYLYLAIHASSRSSKRFMEWTFQLELWFLTSLKLWSILLINQVSAVFFDSSTRYVIKMTLI
jgi:hypothetical protein